MTKDQCPDPSGILVIIGGKEKKESADKESPNKESAENSSADNTAENNSADNDKKGHVGPEILERFAALTEKKFANILVVTSGSQEGEEMFEEYKNAFNDIGHSAIGWVHHGVRREVLEDQKVMQQIEESMPFSSPAVIS